MLTITAKTRKAGKMVNTAHVDNVIRNYKQERWVNNSKHIGKEDSLSVWYSIEELEEFLAKAKSHGADGVKIYFGAYDKNYEGDPLYAGRQTVVFVATKAKESASGILDKDLYISNKGQNEIVAFNFGRLCPPYCRPTGVDGDDSGIGITIVDKGEEGILVV